ncbi:MAG: tetratricopeptide repeat protein [Bacteroidota bacterium]
MKKTAINIYRTIFVFLIALIIPNRAICSPSNIDSLKIVLENQKGKERLTTLKHLGKSYAIVNRNESIGAYKEAYLISNNLNLEQSADIAYQIAYNYVRLQQNDSANKYYSKALAGYIHNYDTLNIMKTSTMKGLALQRMGEFGTSAKQFRVGIDLFAPYWKQHEGEPNISKKHQATMMSNYGISLNNIGQYDSALYYATEAYKLKVEINSTSKQIAKSLVNIGIVYLSANRNDEAIDYFADANELFIPLKDSFNIRKCYNNIGMAYNQMGDTGGAIKNYNRSLEISRKSNIGIGIATSLINLSTLYAGKGEVIKAENYLIEALKIGTKLGNKQHTSTACQNLAKLYYDSNDLNNALEYANRAKIIISETDEMDLLTNNKLLLSNIYEELGNYKQSLHYHKLYTNLHDSLFNVDNSERFNRLQTEFETSKKEQEIILLMKDKERQVLENKILKNRQNTFIIVIILILVLVTIIGLLIIVKRKKDGQIQRQKEIVYKKEKELASAELEKSKLKEEELQQSILYKSKQLSTHALHMMQKNATLHEMQSDLKTLSKRASIDDKPDFKRINLQINKSLRSQKDWDVFKLYFEDVNRNFYSKLNEINPDLTTNDHRLCALIKLNMNSKEMASVLNVAPNSIKSSRYRLKKKLALDVEADLEEFIRGIA